MTSFRHFRTFRPGRRGKARAGTGRAGLPAEVSRTNPASEKEFLELENRYWKAIQDQDVDGAMRLTDLPCLVAGASGVGSIDSETYRRMMTGGGWKLLSFEIKDAKVRVVGDDVALVAYKVHEDLTVEGRKVSMVAADTSVWVSRGGQWRCALHTESLLGGPYGRDRK